MILAEPSQYQHISQYVTDLKGLISYYVGWISNTLSDTPSGSSGNAYEIIMSDATVQHAMELLALWVSGEYFRISGPNSTLNYIGMTGLNYIKDFLHVRKSLAFHGALFGLGVQKKYFEKVVLDEFPGLVWEVPVSIREVDKRRLRIERDTKERDKTWWAIWSPHHDAYMVLKDARKFPDYQPGFTLQDFLFYLADYEEKFPYGRGLAEVIWPMAWLKKNAIQYWGDLAESWSKPWIIMMIDSAKAAIDASLGSGFSSSSARVQALLDVLEKMRARHHMVLDKSDDLKIMEHGSIGQNVIYQLINYMDHKISLLILAGELVTEAGDGNGSYALGQIHRGALQSSIIYHRRRLERILERELLYDFYYRNRWNLVALGIPWNAVIKTRIKILVESEETKRELIAKGEVDAAKVASEI